MDYLIIYTKGKNKNSTFSQYKHLNKAKYVKNNTHMTVAKF